MSTEKVENSKPAVDDATAKQWIKQDLMAAISLLRVILDNDSILEDVTDVVLDNLRDVQPLVDRLQKKQDMKEALKEEAKNGLA